MRRRDPSRLGENRGNLRDYGQRSKVRRERERRALIERKRGREGQTAGERRREARRSQQHLGAIREPGGKNAGLS